MTQHSPQSSPDSQRRPGVLPVRAGEQPWTQAEVEAVRAELHEDLGNLNEELAGLEHELADLLSEVVDGAGDDQADAGTKTFEREHEMALAASVRDMRDQALRAITLLDTGDYGYCTNCGQPIGKLRLQAFPRATLCLTCKQRSERR